MPAYTQQQPQHGYGGDHGSGRLDPNRLPPYARALSTHNPLPPPNEVGYAACSDTDGSPLFLVLVPHNGGLHPGKMVIRPGANHPEIYFSYGGGEISHSGEYALVPFDPQRMHWVPASRSEVLYGARPVDAGYEEDGAPLHFALGIVNGGRVPGKAGRHLGGASVPYNGGEHHSEHPEILCWI
ncbi:hypothetical protein BKA62DRAFT_53934 [Auriculariales sp. MPI-PUGE-AT-0066]|nr:hypothetical protein BKA62DRAFT_53934 [Auriculariales sp. MPI-PUGE-AT-0066]